MKNNFNTIFIAIVTGLFTGVAIYGVVNNKNGLDFLLTNIFIPWLIIFLVFRNVDMFKDKKD